jgi:hypothetical protein
MDEEVKGGDEDAILILTFRVSRRFVPSEGDIDFKNLETSPPAGTIALMLEVVLLEQWAYTALLRNN